MNENYISAFNICHYILILNEWRYYTLNFMILLQYLDVSTMILYNLTISVYNFFKLTELIKYLFYQSRMLQINIYLNYLMLIDLTEKDMTEYKLCFFRNQLLKLKKKSLLISDSHANIMISSLINSHKFSIMLRSQEIN